MNSRKKGIGAARLALLAYNKELQGKAEIDDCTLTDLLADLMHWCDSMKGHENEPVFTDELERAQRNYREEK